MEEDTGQPFSFMERWRGRKLWVLLGASLLAAVAVLLMVWAAPTSEVEERVAAVTEEREPQAEAQPEAMDDSEGGQPREAASQEGGQKPDITPQAEESAPGMVVEFPDPVESGPASPPPGGYKDILGHWVLDMSGSVYGLANCHIILNEDGTISAPPEYGQVFRIAGSAYTWREGSPAFSASLQLILKMSSGQVTIPVQVDLAGNVAESMLEITGSFTASPHGEAYAPYAQQGGFTMHR